MKLLRVTDHCLIRWLERVRGFNFDRDRKEIQAICAGVTSGTVKAKGHMFEIENNAVVTITPNNPNPSRTKRMKLEAKK
jgi:hypothetical protein